MLLKLTNCSCCQSQISPDDLGVVKFNCPNCNEFPIVRCSKCRNLGNLFRCHNCNFTGP
jgi:hypothetical protein